MNSFEADQHDDLAVLLRPFLNRLLAALGTDAVFLVERDPEALSGLRVSDVNHVNFHVFFPFWGGVVGAPIPKDCCCPALLYCFVAALNRAEKWISSYGTRAGTRA